MISAFVAFSLSLIIIGSRTKELNPLEMGIELLTSHLDLTNEQERKIMPLANYLFYKKDTLLDVNKTINKEIIAKMKSENVD